ncbi:hypothetical protein [Escherichia coli]|uniref:hypothetical protein n=1 Tax=Escherichia coli TaxID=562 RepID=UPI000CFB450D|nr:hypothetical protein [Escherichia coli]
MKIHFKSSGGYPLSDCIVGKEVTAYKPSDPDVVFTIIDLYKIRPEDAERQNLVFVKGSDLKSLGAFPEAEDENVYSFMIPYEAVIVEP